MLTFKKLVAIALIFLALFFAIMISSTRSEIINDSIEKNRQMDRDFRKTAGEIERFKLQNRRIPDYKELNYILGKNNVQYIINYSDTNENNCDLYKDFFKNMSKNDYALEIWRNEWMECFIPSTGKSTLVLSPEGYSISGSIFFDRIVLSILIFGCFVFAVFLWRQSDELKWE